MKSVSTNAVRMGREKYYSPVSLFRDFFAKEYFQAIHDPAAGAGHIIDAGLASGIRADGADLYPARDDIPVADFLMRSTPSEVDLVTNPPFGPQGTLAEAFIIKALELTEPHQGKVAMLLAEDFDAGKRRIPLFDGCPQFARKYVMTQRIYWANLDVKDRSSINHAIFVWDHQHKGPPTLHYLHSSDGKDWGKER